MTTAVMETRSAAGHTRPADTAAAEGRLPAGLRNYVRAQVVNAKRHAGAVRGFKQAEFGKSPTAPRAPNVQAVNKLLDEVSTLQSTAIDRLERAGRAVLERPSRPRLGAFMRVKDAVRTRTQLTEKIWLFYHNLFDQRTGPFADKLLAIDRIALDCYQACYMGLGAARSIPTPPPMAYVEAGYGPATYRRGVRMTKLGRRANPFPLVKLPNHRLVNPWSLGAVPHEIGHNLQNDLKLWDVAPKLIRARLVAAGVPTAAVRIWMRWHKEIYADLIGVLLIGPAYVSSLFDIVGKSPRRVAAFSPSGVHPTSYLRPMINTELMRRIGFEKRADAFDRDWRCLYPRDIADRLPAPLRESFPVAVKETVTALCFQPHTAYGGRKLVQVVRFRPQDAATVREAANRLGAGGNPGIVPERFLIAAARDALERRVAPPERIARNFYNVLLGR